MKPIVGITMGDPSGNGPELSVKVLLKPETYDKCRPLIVGDAAALQSAIAVIPEAQGMTVHPVCSVSDAVFTPGVIDVFQVPGLDLTKRHFKKDRRALEQELGEAQARGKEFRVLSGNDSLILPTLKEGGAGGITAVANIYPKTMVSIYQNFIKGDLAAAEAAQNSIAPIRACFKFGNPNTVTKKATNLRGYPVGPCRAPFQYLSEEAVAAIAEVIRSDEAKGMA